MIKGIIFDMDGLLLDTERVYQKCWNEVANEMGIILDPSFKYDICGTSGNQLLDVVCRYFKVNDGNDVHNEVNLRVRKILDHEIPLKKGTYNLLRYLKEYDYKMALASSTDKVLIKKYLKAVNLIDYFDEIISGQEVKHGKPEPDIFIEACNRLNLERSECYVFEDAFNGVRAGYNANIKTIMIPDVSMPNDEINKKAYKIYNSLDDALEAFKNGEI